MLDICQGTLFGCFSWFMSLSWSERIILAVAIFVGMFVFLRIIYKIITSFD